MDTKLNKENIQVLLLEKNNIPYEVFVVKTRRLSLKFTREGILNIRKPQIMPNCKMEMFIEKNIDWIKKNYEVYKKIQRLYVDGEEYLYLGKKYYLCVIENKHQAVHIHEDKMYVFFPKGISPSIVIEKWRKETAEKIFSEVLYSCFKKMEEQLTIYPKLEIKKYKARWGTCYPKKNKISLNIALVHVEMELIEYVIFHELCHYVYLDHSPMFHKLLKKYVPDEKNRRNKLKKYRCYYE